MAKELISDALDGEETELTPENNKPENEVIADPAEDAPIPLIEAAEADEIEQAPEPDAPETDDDASNEESDEVAKEEASFDEEGAADAASSDESKPDETRGLSALKEQFSEFSARFITLEWCVAALFCGVMVSNIIQLLLNSNYFELETYYNSINFGLFFVTILAVTCLLLGLTYGLRSREIIPWALGATTVLLSAQIIAAATNESRIYIALGVAIADLVVALWLVKGDKLSLSSINVSHRTAFFAAVGLFLVSSVFFALVTSQKYLNYVNSTYDFGIFAQMFEKMASTGRADTTVERSQLMSHFGVHFSPIFYLFLPFYYLFRSPLYLFWIQAICVAAGVFAVYLIAKKLGFSGKTTLAFEIIYIFYPSLFDGTFYDFHENKFLTVIILFLFYFLISNKTLLTFVFSLLLLSVKEDAAIYLIVIAVFTMIYLKKVFKGLTMLAMAVVYFILAQQIVAALGVDGVMIWRLSAFFVNGEEGFFSVFKSIFFDIGYLFSQIFTAEKLPFVIWMLLPVVFSPFLTKKVSSLVLLLPMLPVNLMQNWQYQYNVDFQYTYGIAALIIVSMIFVIANLKSAPRRAALLLSLMLCVAMGFGLVKPKVDACISYHINYSAQARQNDELIKQIPKDCSLTASCRMMPHVAYVDEIYSVPNLYSDMKMTDYYLVGTGDSENYQLMMDAMGDNYELVDQNGAAQLYKRK